MAVLIRLFILLAITFFISGCSTSTQYIQKTNQFISSQNLTKDLIKANKFNIVTFRKNNLTNKKLKVYIEGDGVAWLNKYTPSSNPTPANPIALKLMLKDDYKNSIYIARPCQYLKYKEKRNCDKKYWTNKRFSNEVVGNISFVIEHYKKAFNIKEIELVGYSGGATISLLVATKRDDIKHITTVAGNLNPDAWTKHHKVSQLEGLNPINLTHKLQHIPQYHLIGRNDKIVPFKVFDSYINNFIEKKNISYKLYNDFTHNCCWDNIKIKY